MADEGLMLNLNFDPGLGQQASSKRQGYKALKRRGHGKQPQRRAGPVTAGRAGTSAPQLQVLSTGQQQQSDKQTQPMQKPADTAAQASAKQAHQQPTKRQRRDASPEQMMRADSDEDMELGSLVALAMSRESRLQQELQKAGGKAAHHEDAGVVEFGDAEDEPDWQRVQQRAHKHQQQQQKQQQRQQGQERQGEGPPEHGYAGGKGPAGANHSNAAANGHAGSAAGHDAHPTHKKHKQHPQHQQQQQQHHPQQQQKAKPAAFKPGELAHAGAEVPQGPTRNDLFGDSVAEDASGADTFAGLGLSAALSEHLEALNFATPTRVQQQAIPLLVAGRDVMVRAPTGSGKTLAYLAPIVHSLQAQVPRISRGEGTHAIILSPTRELCVQIHDVLSALLRRFAWLVGGLVIGGEHRGHEKARLRKGVAVLVATPGRLLDHLQNTSSFRTDQLHWLVLDEADRLLDLGFEAKLHDILGAIQARGVKAADETGAEYEPRRRQTVLLSATLHARLRALVELAMQEPVAVGFSPKALASKAAGSEDAAGVDGQGGDAEVDEGAGEAFVMPRQLKQVFVEVPAKLRLAALAGALRSRLQKSKNAKMVVFLSTCDGVEFLHRLLCSATVGASGGGESGGRLLSCPVLKLHGDLPQSDRTAAFLQFVKAPSGILLCTDVAARGLDFPAVSSILQFDPPGEPAEYVHRVGRTARMGQKGEALLFLLPSERQYVELLQAHGVQVAEADGGLGALFQCLPAAFESARPGRVRPGRHGGSDPGADASALALQRRLQGAVTADKSLHAAATDAFRSHVRAYSAHPASVKHIFHVRSLHLGHLAHSFALSETPGSIGATGSSAERKKRKREALEEAAKERRRALKKGARRTQGG